MSATATVPQAELTTERVPLAVTRAPSGWCHACDTQVPGPVFVIEVDARFDTITEGKSTSRWRLDGFGTRISLCDLHATAMCRQLVDQVGRTLSDYVTYGEVRS